MKNKITIFNEEIEMEKQRILNILNDVKEEQSIKPTKPIKKLSGFKLYLNNLIKLFNINRNKLSLMQIIKIKLTKWWIDKNTETFKDLVKFITIHGFMGASALICLLTITKVDIALVNIIRQNVLLTCLTYFVGTGSAYYLLIDFNDLIVGSWGKIRNKKR